MLFRHFLTDCLCIQDAEKILAAAAVATGKGLTFMMAENSQYLLQPN